MKSLSVTIHIIATGQFFRVVLFIILCTVIVNFESVGEISKCDHSYDSYWAVLSRGTAYYTVHGDCLSL